MRAKIVTLALLLVALLAVGATAETFGVGGAFAIDALGGLPNSAMLSIKVPQLPILWGVGAQLGGGTFNLAMTADWWLYETNLISFIGLYVGPGLYLRLPDNFEIGGRIPVGLNAFPLEFLELFAELAVAHPFWSEGGLVIPSFRLQGAFGFRFWFNL